MPAEPTLAIQVVNFRTRRYLERCVETVVADLSLLSGLAWEINLLDNASGEDLGAVAERFSGARAFTAPENLGFGGGHNLLAGKTQAPYLLILNPDVEITAAGTISRLLEVVAGDPGVSVAGPKLLMADGSPQAYDHGRLHGARAAIALRGGHSYWRATDVRQEVAWVSGAAMLVEHAAFRAVGGFDEKLFLYKEDEDLCLRLRANGTSVIYEPGVTVRHVGAVVADRASELAGAANYFFAKHYAASRSRRAFAAAHQTLAYLGL